MTRRRGNGEGTITRRADGRVEAALSYTDRDGVRRRYRSYAHTWKDAKVKLDGAKRRRDEGAPVKDSNATVGAFVTEWIDKGLAASPRKESTKQSYAIIARTHLVPDPFGAITLERLRPSDVEQLLMTRKAMGRSASTCRTIYSVLRAALDIAVRDGLVRANVAAAVKRPSEERHDAAYLNRDQVNALLTAARTTRLRALYVLMLGTGLRRGEALALRWSDIDFARGVLRVRGTLNRVNGLLVVSEPKTKQSRRSVSIPAPVVSELRAHRVRQTEERLAAGPVWLDTGMVFTTEIGKHLDPRNALRGFVQLARVAGLPDGVGLHTLRHTAASTLIEAGAHMRAVQEVLGHEDVRDDGTDLLARR